MAVGLVEQRSADGPVAPRVAPRLDVAFLLLDGLRRPKMAPSQDVVLCALGLSADGQARPLALRVTTGESEEAWSDLLRGLVARGVGRGLLLVCCDDHPALLRAVRMLLPDVPLQISVSHRLLALARKVDPERRAECMTEVRAIFSAPDPEAAVARFRAWRSRWAKSAYRATSSLEEDLASCLTFYRFPAHLWAKIRTVNLVERAFRMARRAARPEAAVVLPGLPDPEEHVVDLAETAQKEAAAAVEPISVEPTPFEPQPAPELRTLSAPESVDEPAPEPALEPEPDVPAAAPDFSRVQPPSPVLVSTNGHTPAARSYAVDLSMDPDFVWWLGHHRRSQSRYPRLMIMMLSLAGLLVGLLIARGL